jgi:UDP-glucose 4-epimerase
VDDVLDAMAAVLAEGTRNEAFNLGSGVGVSVAEIVELVREVTGLDVQIQREPAAYAGVDRNVLDASRLTAATGWRPKVDLREGMERTWRSVREAD